MRNAVTFASVLSACDKGAQWLKAMDVLREISDMPQTLASRVCLAVVQASAAASYHFFLKTETFWNISLRNILFQYCFWHAKAVFGTWSCCFWNSPVCPKDFGGCGSLQQYFSGSWEVVSVARLSCRVSWLCGEMGHFSGSSHWDKVVWSLLSVST